MKFGKLEKTLLLVLLLSINQFVVTNTVTTLMKREATILNSFKRKEDNKSEKSKSTLLTKNE